MTQATNENFVDMDSMFVLDEGRLTKDPEYNQYTAEDGTKVDVTKVTIATDDGYFDKKTNQWKDHTSFFRMTAFGDNALHLRDWGRKGRQITAIVTVEDKNYEKNGKTIWYTDIRIENFKFLDTKDAFSNDKQTQNTQSADNTHKDTLTNAQENANKKQEHLSTDEKLEASQEKIMRESQKRQHEKAEQKKQGSDKPKGSECEQTALI